MGKSGDLVLLTKGGYAVLSLIDRDRSPLSLVGTTGISAGPVLQKCVAILMHT